jgi:hypothetical protein
MKKLLLLLCIATSAHAEFMDGNKLLDDMQSSDPGNRMFAMGYIAGVADAGRSTISCPSPNVTIGQMRDAVRQHLDSTPTLRHHTADVIVNYVLSKAWPCAKRGTSL